MRVSYKWLQKYVDISWPVEELARRFTLAGLEVDEIVEIGKDFSGVVVAKVVSCQKIEKSDHLSICKVDIGAAETVDIICGAPNVREGLLVACAKVDAVLPGEIKIQAKESFGYLSQGMLCSQKELDLADDQSGIWELDDLLPADDPPLGTDIAHALDLADQVIIIELTPNRSDCLGMINLARETATYTKGAVKYPDISYPESADDITSAIKVEIADPKLCPRYTGRLVKGIKMGGSPLWMQNCLRAAGMRPINNVVDITNFIMLEMNQPLHAFDYQKIAQSKVIVQAAQKGETLQTLDGKDRTFTGGEILICDGAGPVCIGGVMGNLATEVTEATTDVFIEAAAFDPVSIRQTARRHGIPSEASMRFEKGIDIANCDKAAERAAQLLVKYCSGTAYSGAIDENDGIPTSAKVDLRARRVNNILGTQFSYDEIKEVISSLGFASEEAGDETLAVSIPSYRSDITLEVDLIEEVARLKGFDLIPQTLPLDATVGGRNSEQALLCQLKNTAVTAGLDEVVNYSFIHPGENDALLLASDHPWRETLQITNPLSEDQSVMRRSLIPGLLRTAERNYARRNLDLRLFETGWVFVPAPNQADITLPTEILTLSLLMTGQAKESWLKKKTAYDYFDLKGVVEFLANTLGIDKLDFTPTKIDFLHPGRSAQISLDGLPLGFVGELHPAAAQNYQLDEKVLIAELSVTPIFLAAMARGNKEHDLPRYPASLRDIAVIGNADIPEQQIAQTILDIGGEYLRQVRLFDLYDKEPIPKGKRSLAYSLEFRNESRTLKDSEVDDAFAQIVKVLADKYDYQLRE